MNYFWCMWVEWGAGGKDKCCSTICRIFMSFIAAILFFCTFPPPAVACRVSEDNVPSVCHLSYVNRGCSIRLDRSHPYKRAKNNV